MAAAHSSPHQAHAAKAIVHTTDPELGPGAALASVMGHDWPGLSVAHHHREGPVGFASDLAASHAYLDPPRTSGGRHRTARPDLSNPLRDPPDNSGLKRSDSRRPAGAVGQVELGETPLATRSPTVTGSAVVAEIMQCAAWVDMSVIHPPVLEWPDRCQRRDCAADYRMPSTSAMAAGVRWHHW